MSLTSLELKQVQTGRKKFLAMVSAYFMGNFTDNFYKQAAMLLSIGAGKAYIQGVATILFALPFVLFSSIAGWLADRYPKRYIIMVSKGLELIAVLIGVCGLLFQIWGLVLVMVFIMGLQATLFGPALNGSIPELYPPAYVNTANAIVKVATTLAILLGISLAGITLDQAWWPTQIPFGIWLVAAIAVVAAIIGLIVSFFVYRGEAKDKKAPFPLGGPLQSVVDFYQLRKRRDLFAATLTSTFFYTISTLIILELNALGLQDLKLSQTMTSLAAVSLMVGVCIGAGISTKIATPKKWMHLLAPASLLLSIGLFNIGFVSFLAHYRLFFLFFWSILTGTMGGILIIPTSSYLQIRPEAHEKGKILGLVNFADFAGIILAGQLYTIMVPLFSASRAMNVLALISLLFTIFIHWKYKRLRRDKIL